MRVGRNEIIAELTEHMRKFGGEPGEWCVGIAETDSKFQIQDAGSQIPDSKFQIPDSKTTLANMPGLAYREAHTAYAAADAVDYLVSAFGLRPAAEAGQRSAKQPSGKIVFVYRGPETAARNPQSRGPFLAHQRAA
ncbi:MAG TPA: hypothetical protein VEN79_07215 [Terriglobia bacterium]|nr:hypothetical protein [Terriglobia bacterium]